MNQKIFFSLILFLCLVAGGFVSAVDFPAEITISPENYFAGDETLYFQGRAEPDSRFFIFLNDIGGKTIKKWLIQSDLQGNWSFVSKDLVKTGRYNFVLGKEDGEKAVYSEEKPVEVFLNGVFLFGAGLSFKNLAVILTAIFVFFLAAFGFFFLKFRKAKRKIQKEVKEARDICNIVFEGLQDKVKKRVELIDSQPGFNLEEKKTFDDLDKFLNAARFSIEKEITDVEKLIK